MHKVMLVFGTRPEAIKMCPVVREFQRRGDDFQTVVAVTGQHEDMLNQVLSVFRVTPDHNLHIMRPHQTLFDVTARILEGMRGLIESERPEMVLVHGDTSTAFAAGLAAFYLQVPVAHVEAGLRTYDIHNPFPEEFNRQAIDSLCELCFAPTQLAAQNLAREGHHAKVLVTGNTAIDALAYTVSDDFSDPLLDWACQGRMVLMTAHRRESVGPTMANIFAGVRQTLDEEGDVRLVFPMHLNPAVRELAHAAFDGCDQVRLVEPMDAVTFHNFMHHAYAILTDSGGIQEEAPSMGKPVLVMRQTTERPEGVEAGTLRLVGTTRESVHAGFRAILDDPALYAAMSRASNPYGDGHASERIADAVLAFLEA